MTAYDILAELLTREFEVAPDAIRPDAGLGDLGLNSLLIVELIFALEDKLDIDIPVEEASFETLGEAAELVERLLAAKEG